MKKRLQGLFAGVLIGLLLVNGTTFAKQVSEWVDIAYNNIKIYIDGKQISAQDASGNTVEPFILNGTTYLPVRAVADAFGKNVSWDGNTQSVIIGENPEKVLPASSTEFNAASVLYNITQNTYTYNDSYEHYLAIVPRNNASCDTYLNARVIFKDANGAIIGIDENSTYLNSGQESCLVVSNEEPFAFYEIEYSANEAVNYKPVQKDIAYTISPVNKKLMVEVSNNGTEEIDTVSIEMLFFKNGQVVYTNYAYFTNLAAGSTEYDEVYAGSVDYDVIQAYVDGYVSTR